MDNFELFLLYHTLHRWPLLHLLVAMLALKSCLVSLLSMTKLIGAHTLELDIVLVNKVNNALTLFALSTSSI